MMSFIISVLLTFVSLALVFVSDRCITYINGYQNFHDREAYYREKSTFKFWYWVGCISSIFSIVNLIYESIVLIVS